MITKDLESKIIDAISQKFALQTLPKFQITGSWQPSIDEDEDSVAVVAVAIGTPSSPTFSAPNVVFTGSVVLSIRSELDQTKDALVKFADALCELFKTWQSSTYQAAFTSLDLPGLSVDEVSIQGGRPPISDRTKRIVSVDFPFSLSGSYRSVPADSSAG